MYDKSRYSFLLGFARQLEKALQDDDVELSDAVDTLGLLLALLLERVSADASEDASDADDGFDVDVDDGDGPPLGSSLAGRAQSSRDDADMVQPRILSGGNRCTPTGGGLELGSKRRRAPVLKKGARRGKK